MTRVHVGVIGARGVGALQGGIERYCSEFYAQLPPDQFEVSIFVRSRSQSEPRQDHVRIVMLPALRSRNIETVFHSFLAVIAARMMGIRTLHIHGIGPCLHLPLARLLGMRAIVRHVGADYERAKWGMFGRWMLRLGELACGRYAETIVCLNPHIAASFTAATGRRDTVVIPNGVRDPAEATSIQLPIPTDVAPGGYVLAVGRIVPEKNFHQLIEAFLHADLPSSARLVLVGEIDYPGPYSRRIARLCDGQEGRVLCTGVVFGPNLWALYRNARLFVLPSAHEGMSFSLLEAGISGAPLIASDIAANREVCRGFGRFYPVESVSALRVALEEEWRRPIDPSMREAQSDEFRRRFAWTDVARAMAPLLAGRCHASAALIPGEAAA